MRYFIGMVLSYPLSVYYGVSYLSSFSSISVFIKLQVKGLLSVLAFLILIVAVNYIPITIYSLIDMTLAFWASILGYIFLRDQLTYVEVLAMILGFGGIVIVLAFED